MVSLGDVIALIEEAKGLLMSLLQESDTEAGFSRVEWADEVFSAYQSLGIAIDKINRADLLS